MISQNQAKKITMMTGFQFIHKDRQNGEGGGVAMYLSDDIKWKRRFDLENEEIECIWVEIEIFKREKLSYWMHI